MNRIAELRKQRGLSQSELAKELHIAQNTLSQYESEKRNIPIVIANSLVDFFGVSHNYLFGLPEAPKASNNNLLDVTLVKELDSPKHVNFFLNIGWKLLRVGFDENIGEGYGHSKPCYIIGFWGDPKDTIQEIPPNFYPSVDDIRNGYERNLEDEY